LTVASLEHCIFAEWPFAGIAVIVAGNGSQPQYRHAVLLADQFDRLQQPDDIRRTVVRSDPSGAVTQQILTVLKTYA